MNTKDAQNIEQILDSVMYKFQP